MLKYIRLKLIFSAGQAGQEYFANDMLFCLSNNECLAVKVLLWILFYIAEISVFTVSMLLCCYKSAWNACKIN